MGKLLIGIKDNGEFYNVDPSKHTLLFAPTGGGKGVGFVIPNLLSWDSSVVVHDIKMENYKLTKNYRQAIGQEVFLFNPLDSNTSRYNPFDFIDKDNPFLELERLANLLINECNISEYNLYCEVKKLFIGIACYLISHPGKKASLGEMGRFLMSNSEKELFKAINTIPFINANIIIKDFLDKDNAEANKILSTLKSELSIFMNPLVDYATSESDFNIEDLKNKKMTLYVGFDPVNTDMLRGFMQFFYQHLFQRLMYDKGENEVLFMIDDFTSIGEMDLLIDYIPYFRGYKIGLLLFTQNLEQIQLTYGVEEASILLSNINSKISFNNTYNTGGLVSQLSNNKFSVSDIINLRKDEEVLISPEETAKLKKIVYYKHDEFKNKMD